MLAVPIDLTDLSSDTEIFDYLYLFFEEDFIEQRTLLAGSIYLDPNGQGMRNGREEVFWHITTRERTVRVRQGNQFIPSKSRLLDPDRASRIDWIRPILLNHNHTDIKLFYRKETTGRKPIRLYLWAHQHDFVVIVQKLGASGAFLVTSFYITEVYKRASYARLYAEYTSGVNQDLQGCEWF
ncbi:hypothetical protein [Neptunomonas sp.]|uniref:hypothetical protein n=1 Tax=Neptunomonas sp. TaxID=1971898 RepID=UPI003561E02D